MATLSTSPISLLLSSWTKPNETVDVEIYGLPEITKWTKAQVKTQFASKDLSPMSCPHLPAVRVPEAIVEINNSRDNAPAMQYYMSKNRFWLAHRMLLQAQFQSAVRFTTDECYYLLEEGEAVVEVNGRPLTGAEKGMLDVDPGKSAAADGDEDAYRGPDEDSAVYGALLQGEGGFAGYGWVYCAEGKGGVG
ncbi:hypothetical protein J4E93_006236 [Alternaria ventricosa]|uniref:uncharacterized protein n=1 Tax=Alternaria ventricosa TaxID=1187951 RepID=UPI0020C4DEB0|nr:uncharacterized protein J4E93_006236 [Alternaria ventricosa]KAI4644335.1 hypothetical protein J4E93_006236 [Alternaria ventricosa]